MLPYVFVGIIILVFWCIMWVFNKEENARIESGIRIRERKEKDKRRINDCLANGSMKIEGDYLILTENNKIYGRVDTYFPKE
jgi:hypothetical protein